MANEVKINSHERPDTSRRKITIQHIQEPGHESIMGYSVLAIPEGVRVSTGIDYQGKHKYVKLCYCKTTSVSAGATLNIYMQKTSDMNH